MPIVPPDRLSEVVAALRSGGVAIIPTDTVYGIAARADDSDAIHRLADLKGRDREQPIAVLFDSFDIIHDKIGQSAVFDRLRGHWPGPLTVIVAARGHNFAPELTPNGAVGIRQPDDDLAREVLRQCGGMLAVTSANRHGEPPATTAEEAAAIFGPDILILDGGERQGTASTVVDLTTEPPTILREGPLTAAQLGLDTSSRSS